jgi:hypothetical protein
MAGTTQTGPLSWLSGGQGAPGGSGWEPTVIYLLLLTVAEMVLFGFLSRVLR